LSGTGDDLPTFGKPHPGLHLPPDPAARPCIAIKQCRGDRGVAAIGRDYGLVGRAPQTDRRARRAKHHDLIIAIEIFTDAVAQRAGIVAEQFVEHGDVVRHQRRFIARERRGHLSQHIGEIDLHF